MNQFNEFHQGTGCREFRDKLSCALEGRPLPKQLSSLAWHEHLVACPSCRLLLEREEALEVLLATLPEPKLPPDLTRRLVARLSEEDAGSEPGDASGVGLDDLLDVAGAPVPAGLGARVRAGLRSELALDALLDLDSEVVVPPGLSADILRGLSAERRPPVSRLRLVRSAPAYAAAAGFLLAAVAISFWSGAFRGEEAETPKGSTEEVAVLQTDAAPGEALGGPEDSLLAVLDLIENDELWLDTQDGAELAAGELDLHLLLSDSLEMSDELLLTYIEEDLDEIETPSGG